MVVYRLQLTADHRPAITRSVQVKECPKAWLTFGHPDNPVPAACHSGMELASNGKIQYTTSAYRLGQI
jgi:hypothetical protein